jgi:uncharacterized membrane protein HdeD (DUF308 family)
MLDTMLSRHWWAIALRGVVSVAFGATALVWPGALMFLFGAYALVDGILALGTAAFVGRLAGLYAIVLGVALVVLAVRLRQRRGRPVGAQLTAGRTG